MKRPVIKVALEVRAILPLEASLPVLLALIELPDVSRARLPRPAPRLYPVPVLHVVVPVALVLRLAVDIYKYAKAVSFVLRPLPLVDVPVRVSDAPLAVSFTPKPHAFKLGAVRPELDAHTLSLAGLLAPLALVLLAAAHVLEGVNVKSEVTRVFRCSYIIGVLSDTLLAGLQLVKCEGP